MPDLPDKTDEEIHELASGVTFQWLRGGRMMVFTISEVVRESIDVWVEAVKQIVTDWSLDAPFFVAYDVSAVALTPYLRQRMDEAIQLADHLQGRYVIIASKDVLSQSMRLFIITNLQRPSTRRGDMFTNREKALAWLEEGMNQ